MALNDSTGSLFGKARQKHPHQRFAAITVRNLRAPGRYADGNGLYLLIDEAGAKRWLLRTVVDGRRRDIGLGSVRLVTLAAARVEAARLRLMARTGGDPLAERRQARRAIPTFRTVAKTVHGEQKQAFRNPKHAAQWWTSIDTHVLPVIGDRPVDRIGPNDVLEVLKPLWTKTPETARRVKQRLRLIFDYAKASEFRRGDNPVDGITKVLPKIASGQARHHPALPYAQLPAFIEALREANATEHVRLAFELLILTAARTTEVRRARPAEFDLAAGIWTIPADRMKANREHQVPLAPRCVEIVERALALASDSPFVFPGRWLRQPLSDGAFLMVLDRLKRDDITAHGFRSTFRDWAAERTSFSRDVVEATLAHVVKNKTEAAYLRTKFFEQRRELMATWTRFATTPPGKVVSIRA